MTVPTGRVRGVSVSAGGRGHRLLKPRGLVPESRHDEDARLRREPQQQQDISVASCARATPERNMQTRGRRQHRRPSPHRRHRSQTSVVSPERVREASGSGGWGREEGIGSGGSEEELGGWCSAPEGSGGGVGVGRRKPHSVRGGANGRVGTSTEWRSRGAMGRRPASREAARQLRVSERLHRLAQTMAKKKEKARRRRDDLQQARVRRPGKGSVPFTLHPRESRSCLKLTQNLMSDFACAVSNCHPMSAVCPVQTSFQGDCCRRGNPPSPSQTKGKNSATRTYPCCKKCVCVCRILHRLERATEYLVLQACLAVY